MNTNRTASAFGSEHLVLAADLDILTALIEPTYYASASGQPQRNLTSSEQAARHYLESDWLSAGDPTPWFSNRYYLTTSPDVAAAGINPLVHYVRHGHLEGRWPLPHLDALPFPCDPVHLPTDVAEDAKTLSRRQFLKKYGDGLDVQTPLVTAIVPNYNHAPFLDERLASIMEQTYDNVEVVVLDDCSTDGSQRIIDSYISRYGSDRFRYIPNERNSGNVFRQWRKGVEHASGDLLWICESDDTAERDFLEELVPSFNDLAVLLGFGRTQFVDENGYEMKGLDGHRESTEPGVWHKERTQPAAAWFAKSFSTKNIIPNVGGCLIRNQPIAEEVWNRASQFSVLGDWYLYLTLARGGKVSYKPEAVTYFRQHASNTSTNSFGGDAYYREHEMLATDIRRTWPVPTDTTWAFYRQLLAQFGRNHQSGSEAGLADLVSFDKLLTTERRALHVLIGFNGFQVGGGEYYPLYLANALRQLGVQVSLLALDLQNQAPEMLKQLDKRVPVYSAHDVRAIGPDAFLQQTGVDLIHSHHIGVEVLFHASDDERQVLGNDNPFPYVASLHGTYEVTDLNEHRISRAAAGVTHWVHTTDKNLAHHRSRSWLTAEVSKMANAMPINEDPWHISRADLGIDEHDFVFALIARPIPEKGWQDAIAAVAGLHEQRQSGERRLHLLLVGEGPLQQELAERWAEHPAIHFVGFQSNVHGILRASDCCLLPTRFTGESFPLILIQAIQTSTPCIATDAGEIRSMLSGDTWDAGLVVKWHQSDEAYVNELQSAMREVQRTDVHERLTRGAMSQAPLYDMALNAAAYLQLYKDEIDRLHHQQDVLNLDEADRASTDSQLTSALRP